MTRVFRVVPSLFAGALIAACNVPSEAPSEIRRAPEEPLPASVPISEPPATDRAEQVVIIRSDDPPHDRGSTLEYTRWIMRRAIVLDRDIGMIENYLPTFSGDTRADLEAALADIEALRMKLQRDLASLRGVPDDHGETIKKRIDGNLDALELKVAQALVKAKAPGTSS